MSDEEKAFLKAICWNPADDAPRLVYTDWLDEHDREEQAEFIRLQIVAPKFYHCGSVTDRWCPVCGDCCCPYPEESLDHWLCPLHSPTSHHGGYEEIAERIKTLHDKIHGNAESLGKYERGLVTTIHVDHDYFLVNAKANFQIRPITKVAFTDVVPLRIAGARSTGDVDGMWFYRRQEAGAQFQHLLNGKIFDKLPRPKKLLMGCALYPTRETAEDAASVAAVTFGREEAGLPPLK